jgi:hypothetical protein
MLAYEHEVVAWFASTLTRDEIEEIPEATP